MQVGDIRVKDLIIKLYLIFCIHKSYQTLD